LYVTFLVYVILHFIVANLLQKTDRKILAKRLQESTELTCSGWPIRCRFSESQVSTQKIGKSQVT